MSVSPTWYVRTITPVCRRRTDSLACVFCQVFQAVDRFFRVCLIPEACGAFDAAWHDHAIAMLNGPQIKAGHSAVVDNTGLYFCETSTVDAVETTLRALLEEEKDNSARSTDHEDVPDF